VTELYLLKDCMNIIMNSNYTVVETFQNSEDQMQLDPHDFEIFDNSTRIIQVASIDHLSSPLSESATKLSLDRRPIKEAVFQVVDVSTRRVDFEWHSLDGAEDTGQQIRPLVCRIMKAILSVVTSSAAQIRSPSFSREVVSRTTMNSPSSGR